MSQISIRINKYKSQKFSNCRIPLAQSTKKISFVFLWILIEIRDIKKLRANRV